MKFAPFILAAGFVTAVAASPIRPVFVTGHSMDPTLHTQQITLASRDVSDLKRGDVVVVETPEGTSVKRIAFLEGDEVPQYNWKGEWITPRSKEMRRTFELKNLPRRNYRIPYGCIYIVGDNRARSIDSRDYGPVPVENVRLRLENLPDAGQGVPGSRFAGKVYSVNAA